MKREINKNTVTLNFTPSELVEYIRGYKNPNSHGIYYEDKSYCKFSYNDAVEYLSCGWEEGVQEIAMRIEKIKSKEGLSEQECLARDVEGDYFDVGLVLTGEPECWYQEAMLETPHEELTVYINIAYACGINQDAVYNRGAVITSIIDKLKKKYLVKIIFGSRNSGHPTGNGISNTDFYIKIDTQNHYSRSLVAFMVANPGMHRRIMFAILEKETGLNYLNGYGCPSDKTPKQAKNKNWLVFPKLNYNTDYCTINRAKKTLDRIIEAYTAEK